MDVPSRISDKVDDAKQRIADAAHGIGDKISSTASNAASTASAAARSVASAIPAPGDIASAASHMVEENPLAPAFGALAFGLIIGLLAPATRMERENVRPLLDGATKRARDMGRSAMDQALGAVREAVSAVTGWSE
jgi:ElaB/YqjD/DUF883 family membrane-anchored ribosome-binding protein